MQTHNIPSAQLAVTRESRLVYARGYRWDYDDVDPVEPDSLFRIASITKPIVSAGVMLLVQQGQLNLTDNLVNLITLPTPADAQMNNITVLNLLQHQGGWDRDTTFDPMFYDLNIASALGISFPISQQDIIDFMTARSLDFAPGTRMVYSNYGYLLLGRIIEAVTGQSFGAFIQANVLAPLGMNQTSLGATFMEFRQPAEVSYYVSDPKLYPNVLQAGAPANVMAPYGWFNLENMDAHGGYVSNAIDLARFARIFDATSGFPLLTQANVDLTFAVPATGVNANGSWYGLGWSARTAGAGLNTWHDGSLPGTSTLLVRRNDGLNWIILFNQRDDISDPTGATYGQIDGLLHAAADAVTNWPPGDLFP
jgi:CubicO group peptidase (beta-lactamase class C family)